MKISLHRNEYTNSDFKVRDSLYGRSFSLYELLVDFLNDPLNKYIDPLYQLNNNQLIDFIKISNKSIDIQEYKVSRLRELVNQYIDDYSIEELKEFKESFITLLDENFSKGKLVTAHKFESDIRFFIDLSNGILREEYEVKNIQDYSLLVLSKLIESDINLRRCENCGIFFLPDHGLEQYCNNIFKDGKTCKEIGSLNKVKSDKYLNQFGVIYRRTTFYKTDPDIIDEVDFWRKYASLMRKKYKKNLITGDELIELIDGSQKALLEVKGKLAKRGWTCEWIEDNGEITKEEYNQLLERTLNKGGKG